MMSPAIEGVAARTPGRQNQSAVRLSLAHSFEQEFAVEHLIDGTIALPIIATDQPVLH